MCKHTAWRRLSDNRNAPGTFERVRKAVYGEICSVLRQTSRMSFWAWRRRDESMTRCRKFRNGKEGYISERRIFQIHVHWFARMAHATVLLILSSITKSIEQKLPGEANSRSASQDTPRLYETGRNITVANGPYPEPFRHVRISAGCLLNSSIHPSHCTQIENSWMDFQEVWHGRYATERFSKLVHFNFHDPPRRRHFP
jgi:hypothetical protein